MTDGDDQPKRWRTDVTSLIWFTTLVAIVSAVVSAAFRRSRNDQSAEAAETWLFVFAFAVGPSALIAALAIKTRGRALIGTAVGAIIGGLLGGWAVTVAAKAGATASLLLVGIAAIAGAWAGGGWHAARLGHHRIGVIATIMATFAALPAAAVIAFFTVTRLWKWLVGT